MLNFPKIEILENNSLESIYSYVLNEFKKNNINVREPDLLNEIVLCKDIAKIFNVYEENRKYTFFVTNINWNDDNISKILNSFTKTDDSSYLYFYSFYPLPDLLKYLSRNSKESFFEFDCIKNFKAYEDIETVKYISNKFKELLTKHFNIDLKNNPAEDLKNIEKIISTYFRKIDDYESIYETDIDYFPHYSLVFFALYIVNLMCENLKGEVFHDKKNEIGKLGVGFSIKDPEIIEIVAHPVEKVFKYFFYGKNNSIINWYYEIKYLLDNNSKK